MEGSNSFVLCDRSCQKCGGFVPPGEKQRKKMFIEMTLEYDLKKVPIELRKVAFLIGKWRSEFGGKAFFPTIPR